MLHATRGFPPFMEGAPFLDDCGHWWILLPSRGGKSKGRVKNPRVGWVKSMSKVWKETVERDEINTQRLFYTS